MLDTKICIYIRQRRPEEVLRRFRKLRPGEAVLSVITYGELLYGAGLTLVTNNEGEFRRVRGLKIQNWAV
jgi:predicted nucleic acid-binding protein